MRNRAITIVLLLLLSRSEQALALEPTDCVPLLHSRCEVCHYNTRYCQKLGQKNQRGWLRSIKTMVAYGAKLTPEEQLLLADCLAAAPPAVQAYCKAP